MIYSYFILVVTTVLGTYLLFFRKQFVKWQKKQAINGKGVVNKKLVELPERHLEFVAIFGGLICLTVAVLTIHELVSI